MHWDIRPNLKMNKVSTNCSLITNLKEIKNLQSWYLFRNLFTLKIIHMCRWGIPQNFFRHLLMNLKNNYLRKFDKFWKTAILENKEKHLEILFYTCVLKIFLRYVSWQIKISNSGSFFTLFPIKNCWRYHHFKPMH